VSGEQCEECGGPARSEPLGVGSLTIKVCDRCEEQTDQDLASFLDRVRRGDFGDSE
jgi:hypothetical protein